MSSAPIDPEDYLEWIGFGGTPRVDLETLTRLQRLHMTAVPFENLDIALGTGDGERVSVDAHANVDKIVERGRGGWCFELNGAFALLLEAIGFRVVRLGAAVLLDGPSRVIEHLTLEVMADEPYLVDVGFGASSINPIALNRSGPQDGGSGTFELIGSPEGTTLTRHVDGVPAAQYRFKRVALTMEHFALVASEMQVDPNRRWRTAPFATRLLDGGPDRVTLTRRELTLTRDGVVTTQPVSADEWASTLHGWFGIRLDDPT